MTSRELIMLLLNRDLDAEVAIELRSDKECDFTYGDAQAVFMHGGKVYITCEDQ